MKNFLKMKVGKIFVQLTFIVIMIAYIRALTECNIADGQFWLSAICIATLLALPFCLGFLLSTLQFGKKHRTLTIISLIPATILSPLVIGALRIPYLESIPIIGSIIAFLSLRKV